MLDYYLEDKIFELAEEVISIHVPLDWFETPSKYSNYVSLYTGTNDFAKDLAERLNKAGYLRDTDGNKIDWKWVDAAWNHEPYKLRSEGGYDKEQNAYDRQAKLDYETERLC